MENNIKQVIILDTKYTKAADLVEWKVFIENDNKEMVLAIKGEELGYFLGLNVLFNEELILEANRLYKGKRKNINFIKDKMVSSLAINATEEEAKSKEDNIDRYPIKNILKAIEENEKK